MFTTISRLTLMLCLLVVNLAIAACGVKPKTVDAPQGVENDTFPTQTYPAK